MIDEKKIEDAAIENSEKLSDGRHFRDLIVGFKSGAEWAINDFLKDLWHDASEEIPKEKAELFVKLGNEYFSAYRIEDYYYVTDINNTCEVLVKIYEVTRWLYIDDLLKGGNNG